jgi:glucan biosynthesis protein C
MSRPAQSPIGDAAAARHYGLDWLRIGAFMLLILYHVGMVFTPGRWLVKVADPVPEAVWLMLAVEPWRMPLLFVVSGYASYALLAKTGDVVVFLRSRSRRLLLPLVFGILAIVPPQTWVAMVENHHYAGGALRFWANDWLSFARIDGVFLPAVEHLWFIPYLWTYTMVVGAALLLAPRPWKARARSLFEWLCRDRRLVWLPLAPLLVVRIGLLFTVPETHGLLHDWTSDLVYLPAFLFGFALAANPPAWQAIRRTRIAGLALAIGSFLVLLQIELLYPSGILTRPHAVQALDRDASLVMAWSAILLLLGVAHQWLNKDHKLRATFGEMVFPFYLVHQTIIVVAAWSLKDIGVPPLALFICLTLLTLAGCWAFYEAGRRTGPMRILFGLSPLPRRRQPATAAILEPA